MIKVENLSFKFGKTPILSNINLNLEGGKIYGLLGENGVGKTTFLTLLAGLKSPTSGVIDVAGFLPKERKAEFLENIYYLPDELPSHNLNQANFAKLYGSIRPGFDLEKFNEILDLFEVRIPNRMDKMSCGQLKKTYIAFALASNASMILMDEPTNGLDIPSKSQFRKAITKYSSPESVIVISTHQARDLEGLIDPIIILEKEQILLNASDYEITQKLYFDYGNVKRDDSLWTELISGSMVQVCLNQTGEESKVNIEALFNTAHSNKELIKTLFS